MNGNNRAGTLASIEKNRRSLLRRLAKILRVIQRQNHFISRAPLSDLGLSDSHLLLELEALGPTPLTTLAWILMADPAVLSRQAQRLKRKRLLSISRITQDRRRRYLAVTSRARQSLRKIDSFADKQIYLSYNRLSRREQRQVIDFYEMLAGGLGAPAAAARKAEHPLRAGQRRMTRALGLLGSTVYGTSMWPLDFHLLFLVYDAGGEILQTALREALGAKPSNLSLCLDKHFRLGIVGRRRLDDDGRRRRIVLQPQGWRAVEELEQQVMLFLNGGCSQCTNRELEMSVAALTQYALHGVEATISSKYRIVKAGRERLKIRAFIMQNAVRLGVEGRLRRHSGSLAGAVYSIELEDIRVGLIVLSVDGRSIEWVAWNAAVDDDVLFKEAVLNFERSLGTKSFSFTDYTSVLLP